jgi:hypothetical protein
MLVSHHSFLVKLMTKIGPAEARHKQIGGAGEKIASAHRFY